MLRHALPVSAGGRIIRPASFPWYPELEAATDTIRAEALELMRHGTPSIRPYAKQESSTATNKWSYLDDSFDWSACFLWEYGVRNDAVCGLCPETAAILDKLPLCSIPGKAPTAFFSILKPGAHIPLHTGVTNTRAIVHLPLVVPPDCESQAGAETRPWVEGRHSRLTTRPNTRLGTVAPNPGSCWSATSGTLT